MRVRTRANYSTSFLPARPEIPKRSEFLACLSPTDQLASSEQSARFRVLFQQGELQFLQAPSQRHALGETLMDDLDAIARAFLVESHENLGRLDLDLVQLEKTPHDRERLASIFRTIHTIKGTCGFLGYEKLGAVTHAGENLLSLLRDGKLLLSPAITGGLLKLVDAVRGLLTQIEDTGGEGNGAYGDLIATLTRPQEVRAVETAAHATLPMP